MARLGRVLGIALFAGLAGLAGCAGNAALGAASAGSRVGAPTPDLGAGANVRVLDRSQLEVEQGRPVLDAIRAYLPQVRIVQASTACPSLAMRGPNVFPGVAEPLVYLDGEPAGDTCLLEDLPADQLARVEVYPSGVTARPGYRPSSNGLILLFSRRATEGAERKSFRR